jgi:DNA-binding NtrC family response regulator
VTGNYFDEKSIEQIANHAWNGNIREMENRVERAVILLRTIIYVSGFRANNVQTQPPVPSDEKILLKKTTNISKTAEN